jgi:hypothetical protein
MPCCVIDTNPTITYLSVFHLVFQICLPGRFVVVASPSQHTTIVAVCLLQFAFCTACNHLAAIHAVHVHAYVRIHCPPVFYLRAHFYHVNTARSTIPKQGNSHTRALLQIHNLYILALF